MEIIGDFLTLTIKTHLSYIITKSLAEFWTQIFHGDANTLRHMNSHTSPQKLSFLKLYTKNNLLSTFIFSLLMYLTLICLGLRRYCCCCIKFIHLTLNGLKIGICIFMGKKTTKVITFLFWITLAISGGLKHLLNTSNTSISFESLTYLTLLVACAIKFWESMIEALKFLANGTREMCSSVRVDTWQLTVGI